MDTTIPSIILNPNLPSSVTKGDSYAIIKSYSTSTISGGTKSCSSNIDGQLDSNYTSSLKTVGTHIITCTVATNAGKKATATVTIKITYTAYTAINLIQNGSFENGLNGWNVYNGTEESSQLIDEGYHGSKSIRFSHKNGTEYLAVIYQYLPASSQQINHLYYGMMYIRTSVTFSSPDSKFEIYRTNGNNTNLFANTNIKTNQWTKLSNTITLDTTEDYWHVRIYSQWPSDYMYVDSLLILDLTAIFGSGNEPDNDWCDKHINYFDGTTTIYK